MYQDSFYILNSAFSLSEIEVGAHLYWEIAGLKLHGQVFIVSWLVVAALLGFAVVGTRDLKQAPKGIQNFMEYVYEFLQDILVKKNTVHGFHTSLLYSYLSSLLIGPEL
jgi:F-type H+-transporting ATPase subunit a